MEITRDQLRKWGACQEGYEWFCAQELTDHEAICKKLCENGNYKWAYWVIIELLRDDRISLIKFGVYAAEQVLPIFEEAFPDDNRPKEAIEVTKKYIDNPSNINIAAANAAANAAKVANTANVVNAAYTAYYAVYTAAKATYADWAAAYATIYTADAAYNATNNNEIKTRIAEYGLSLIREK